MDHIIEVQINEGDDDNSNSSHPDQIEESSTGNGHSNVCTEFTTMYTILMSSSNLVHA